MRLFIGIFPNKETLDYCRDIYRAFDKEKRNLKQIPLGQTHLTLRFVGGRVSDRSKNLLVEQLRAMQGSLPKPEIKIKSIKFGFPRQHDPRVLFAEVEPSQGLVALQDYVNNVLKKLGQKDTVRFKSHKDREFHISIARLKPAATRSTGRNVKRILENIQIPTPASFVADEMFIVQSIIDSRKKPVYKTLEAIRL